MQEETDTTCYRCPEDCGTSKPEECAIVKKKLESSKCEEELDLEQKLFDVCAKELNERNHELRRANIKIAKAVQWIRRNDHSAECEIRLKERGSCNCGLDEIINKLEKN